MSEADIKTLIEGLDLKSEEGAVELFVDKLDDIGVYQLERGQSITFGTYKNIFACVDEKKDVYDDCNVTVSTIECKFYENEKVIIIYVVKFIVDDEVNETRVYWSDPEGNVNPSENPDWVNILENMDIFLDE